MLETNSQGRLILSRRGFLKGSAAISAAPLLRPSSQSVDYYARPEDQAWTTFYNSPYQIVHPSSWHVFSGEVLLDPLTNPRVVKADVFGGGLVGKKTMKVLVTSETLAVGETSHDAWEGELKQINVEGEALSGEPNITNIGLIDERFEGYMKRPVYYTRFLGFGIERRTHSFFAHDKKWRVVAELQDHEAKVSDGEQNNINRTIAHIVDHFERFTVWDGRPRPF